MGIRLDIICYNFTVNAVKLGLQQSAHLLITKLTHT